MATGLMPIGDFKVTYTNGETAVAQSNFRGLVEVERRWPDGGESHGIEAVGLAVWHYLDCPASNFDEWLGTVHLIEQATVEGEAVEVPTEPAPGDD